MPAAILYSKLTSSGEDYEICFIEGSEDDPECESCVYIRAEYYPGDISEALDAAKPREGETVLNSIPI